MHYSGISITSDPYFVTLYQIDLKAEREFETNLGFILDFTSPEITANKVKQGTK